jgi:hypothetical protein
MSDDPDPDEEEPVDEAPPAGSEQHDDDEPPAEEDGNEADEHTEAEADEATTGSDDGSEAGGQGATGSDDGSEAGGQGATGSDDGSEGDDDADSERAATAGDEETGPGNEWTPDWLADLRANDDRRHAALVAAALVGLGAAMVHWAGLFVAGALVGLASKTLRRAPVAGLAVGVLVLVVHVGASPVMGPGEFLALAPAAYVTVAVALVAPVWGSLVRGVL